MLPGKAEESQGQTWCYPSCSACFPDNGETSGICQGWGSEMWVVTGSLLQDHVDPEVFWDKRRLLQYFRLTSCVSQAMKHYLVILACRQ